MHPTSATRARDIWLFPNLGSPASASEHKSDKKLSGNNEIQLKDSWKW